MNKKSILFVLVASMLLLSTINTVSCSSMEIDVYYNDVLYPGASTPKPLVKIGEPFTIKFDVTCFSSGILSLKLTELADGSFEIITGPTLKLEQYTDDIFEKNKTISYEWTLKATQEWSGGGMPLNLVYQFNDIGTGSVIVQGEFTAAYVTISDEYYDGPIAKPESDQQSNAESPSMPAFTLLAACIAFAGVISYRKYQ